MSWIFFKSYLVPIAFVFNIRRSQKPTCSFIPFICQSMDILSFHQKRMEQLTVLVQFRVRNEPNNRQIVAEEMWLWGYEGALEDK